MKFPNGLTKKLAIGVAQDVESHDWFLSVRSREESQVAETIKLAKRYGVPVISSPRLADLLSQLPIDETIPEELLPALEVVLDSLV